MKILLVDDDVISRKITKNLCQKMGHQVVEAADGEQAWKIFSKKPCPVVISDWVMPGDSGIDLCKKIRNERKKKYSFFFLVTGKKKGVGNYTEAMGAGVDDYIFKPVDYYVLRNQLQVAEKFLGLM